MPIEGYKKGALIPTPNLRMTMPELLIPVRKPVGPVSIDWEHPLTEHLVYFSIPDDVHRKELVSGNPLQVRGDGNFMGRVIPNAGCFVTEGDHSIYSAPSSKLFELTDLKVTMIMRCNPLSSESNGGFLAIPFRDDGTWTTPWLSLSFMRNGLTTAGRIHFATAGAATNNENSAAGFFDFDRSIHTYAVTLDVDDSNAHFYKDGVFHSSSAMATSDDFDWGDQADAIIGSNDRYGGGTAEGVTTDFEYAMIIGRVLTEAEHMRIARDPYQFLKPAI